MGVTDQHEAGRCVGVGEPGSRSRSAWSPLPLHRPDDEPMGVGAVDTDAVDVVVAVAHEDRLDEHGPYATRRPALTSFRLGCMEHKDEVRFVKRNEETPPDARKLSR